jgi:23S rRNA pseudouridine1911/1915/1917 synthase
MKNNKRHGKKGPNQIFHYSPVEDTTLLPFLYTILAPKSKSDIKSMLAHHHVAVNGQPLTQFDTPLTPRDKVSVNFTRPFAVLRASQLHLLYEDKHLVVVEKAAGLLTMGHDNKKKTAQSLLTDYLKQKDARSMAYVCHRLDQYTSGILVFAKDPDMQRELRYNWDNYVRERSYTAVVEGCPEIAQQELRHNLVENSNNMMVYVARKPDEGRLAVTRYRVMQSNDYHALLDIQIFTGRKNQIRVQLAEIGYPVAGDRKYGGKTNPIGRLMLHNHRLSIVHPVTRELMHFEVPAPAAFRKVVQNHEIND